MKHQTDYKIIQNNWFKEFEQAGIVITTYLKSLFVPLPMGQVTSKQTSLVLGGMRTKQFLAAERGLPMLVEMGAGRAGFYHSWWY